MRMIKEYRGYDIIAETEGDRFKIVYLDDNDKVIGGNSIGVITAKNIKHLYHRITEEIDAKEHNGMRNTLIELGFKKE